MMADSAAFECVCLALERATQLSRIQARGTVRLALKKAGLDAAFVDCGGMRVVLQRVMPKELAARSVADAERVCEGLVLALDAADLGSSARPTPDDVFSRLFS
jgi:hypothetical protein